MATIKAILNKQYKGSKEIPAAARAYQIVIRINHKDDRHYYDTGYHVPEAFWDDQKGKIVGRFEDKEKINFEIEELINIAQENYRECRKQGKPFLPKMAFRKEAEACNFSDYLRSAAKRSKESGAISYGKFLGVCLSSLTKWKMKQDEQLQKAILKAQQEGKPLPKVNERDYDMFCHEFTPVAVKDYVAYLEGKLKQSSIKSMLSNMASQWSLAVDDIGAPEKNPLAGIKTRKHGAKRVWLTKGQLAAFEAFKVGRKEAMVIKDMFLFAYNCYGMRFANVLQLKKSDIYGGEVHWKAVKGYTQLTCEIHPQLQAIIDRYMKTPGEYLFPSLNKRSVEIKTAEGLFKCIKARNVDTNRTLRRIAKRLQLPKFTFHSARHTFATHAINDGVRVQHLKEMLGHASISMTENYINEICPADRSAAGKSFYSQKERLTIAMDNQTAAVA